MKSYLLKTIACTLATFCLLSVGRVFAYEPNSTHAALTDEMVDFYNLFVTEEKDKITDEEKEWIVKGSVEEDTPPRWVNHFYDPVYSRGWGGNVTSKEWAQNSFRESLFVYTGDGFVKLSFWQGVLVGSDYTWGRGIKDAVRGDKQRSLEVLGHVLHLIEDSSVPEHTRNDTHISSKDTFGILQHLGSPYEEWAPRFTRETLNISESLKGGGETPLSKNLLDEYFDEIAKYSNGYFFSEDTIDSDEYTWPIVTATSVEVVDGSPKKFGLGLDDANKTYHLLEFVGQDNWRNLGTKLPYSLNNNVVLDDYWSRLSKAAIVNGAGVMRLYLSEVRKARAEEARRQASLDALYTSVINTVRGWWDSTVSVVQSGTSYIGSAWNSVAGWFSGTPSSTQDANLITTVSLLPMSREEVVITPSISLTPTPAGVVLSAATSPAPPSSAEATESTASPSPENFQIPDSSAGPQNDDVVTPQASSPPASSGGGGTDISSVGGNSAQSATSLPEPSPSPTPSPTPIPDTTPPDFVFSVAARSVTSHDMQLLWLSGDADLASYDLSFASSNLSDDGINTATSIPENLWVELLTETNATATMFTAPKDETSYHFRLRARDATGNVSAWKFASADVSRKAVAINEIAWMGTGASFQDEWIELFNRTGETLSVSGWKLRVEEGAHPPVPRDIALSGTIPPHGYYLMERTNDETVSDITADLIFTGAIKNNSTFLTLLDASGETVDATPRELLWVAGDNDTKRSMERVRPELAGSDRYNWFTNGSTSLTTGTGMAVTGRDAEGNPIFGTPKAKNSVWRIYSSTNSNLFLSIDTTWTKEGSPYYIPTQLFVNAGSALTIKEGVVIKFGRDAQLYVGGAIRALGRRSLDEGGSGSVAEPVAFTAFTDDEVSGDTNQDATSTVPVTPSWRQLTVASSASAEFHNTIFRYGGFVPTYTDPSPAMVFVDGAQATFDHATFDNGYSVGLHLRGTNATVRDSTFTGFDHSVSYASCAGFGAYALLVDDGSPVVERNIVDGAMRGMVFCNATPIVRNNIVRHAQQTPITLYSSLGELRGNTIESSAEYGVSLGGILHTSGTLTKDTHPYIVKDFLVYAPAVLTIEPGAILKSRSSDYPSIAVYGSLISRGNAENPIIFTALADDSIGGDTNGNATSTTPYAGSWSSLSFAASSTGSFAYTNIHYGGGGIGSLLGRSALWAQSPAFAQGFGEAQPTSLSFDHTEISDSAGNGLMLANVATSTVTVTNSVVTRNLGAGLHLAESSPALSDIMFSHNTYGIYAQDLISHPTAENLTFENNSYDTIPVDLLGL